MEVENEIVLEIKASSFYFATQCDGDKLVLSNLEMTQTQAASLSWLVNSPPDTVLEVQIKEAGT